MLLSKLLQKDFKTVNIDLRYYVSSTSSCFQFVLTLTSYSNCGHSQRFKDFHCLWLYSCVHFYFHVVQVVFSLCSTCLGQSRRLAVGCLACCKQFALEAFLHFLDIQGCWSQSKHSVDGTERERDVWKGDVGPHLQIMFVLYAFKRISYWQQHKYNYSQIN